MAEAHDVDPEMAGKAGLDAEDLDIWVRRGGALGW